MPNEEIKRLIDAADAVGLVSDARTEGSLGGFTLGGKRYELSFDKNGAAASPTAEYAMRASDAVIDLFSEIEHSYNCFAVSMANIAPPSGKTFGTMLHTDSTVTVSEPVEMVVSDRLSGEITHMLEVIIDIFLGDSVYKTVIDKVFVDNPDGSGYRFRGAGKTNLKTNESIRGAIDEADRRAAERVLDGLRGANIGKTYQGILDALCRDESSRLYRFLLEKSKEKNPQTFGRIEMRIRSFYLGAERVKTFEYRLTAKDGYTQTVTLVWDKASCDAKDTSLYIKREGDDFIGVTCEAPKGAGALLSADDKLIYAKTPVRVEGGRLSLRSRFFPRSMLGRHACSHCRGVYFSSFGVDVEYKKSFLLLDGSFGCEMCCTEGKTVVRDGKKYKYSSSAKRFRDDAQGAVFALAADIGSDELARLTDGGNAFVCSCCGLTVYRGVEDVASIPTCDICGGFVCKSCRSKMENELTAHYESGEGRLGVCFCTGCQNAESLEFDGRALKIYEAYEDASEAKLCFVLDGVTEKEISTLERCAGCERLIYTGNGAISRTNRCERCGAFFGNVCFANEENRHESGAPMCQLCMDELNRSEWARATFAAYIDEKNKFAAEDIRIAAIESLVRSRGYLISLTQKYKNQLLASMSFFDRRELDYADLSVSSDVSIRAVIGQQSYDNLAPRIYEVAFIVRAAVKKSAYRFIINAKAHTGVIEDGECCVELTNEKITYGGVTAR